MKIPGSLSLLNVSLFATIALAALIVAASFWLGWRNRIDDEWVAHTLEVRANLSNVANAVESAEASQRGYLLTAQELHRAPYEAAVQQIPGLLAHIQDLTADNTGQQRSIAELRGLIDEKVNALRTTIDAYKTAKPETALAIVANHQGVELMDKIRRAIDAMDTEEGRLLVDRRAAAERSATLLQIASLAAFAVLCIIGFLSSRFTRTSIARLTAARNELIVANQQLLQEMHYREDIENQLRQAQKMEAIGQLTGGIAHDFNNMLGAIMAGMDLVKRRIRNGDFEIERFLDGATEAAKRAAMLTKRLLAFARQQPLAPQPLDADKLIASMSELLRASLGEHINIEIVAAAGLWTISADAQQLENAILNIALNARDAMPDGGRVTIETANAHLDEAYCRQNPPIEPGQYVMIAITDTGLGMTAETIARAFDPFFTTKLFGSGTGLGLSQVYGFVKQSRGHTKIYSEVGAGTTVKMYFPRLSSLALPIKPAAAEVIRTGNASEIILVVEDEPLVRRATTEALSDLGYTVYDADGAADALAILDRIAGIKLLFTDVVMPDIDGRKLADEALRRRLNLKVLFTTAYTTNAVVHGGVLDSGVNFISKPFTLEQLASKVRDVLDA